MISAMPDPAKPSAKVLEALGLAEAKLTLFKSGLINDSWRADTSDGNTVVVQRVNPIFPVATLSQQRSPRHAFHGIFWAGRIIVNASGAER